MPTPIMITTGTTATGDIITGTCAKYIVKGMPVVTLTNPVAGPVCTGVVSASTAVNKICMGLPMADVTAVVNGANTVTGVPLATTAVNTAAVNYLI
ncbi:MAG: hypothetical protein Q4F30_01365 [Akkermansia sp.]|nr:hypothetical protein [Akkermansia sp.]